MDVEVTQADRALFKDLERFVFQGYSGVGLDGESIEIIAAHRLVAEAKSAAEITRLQGEVERKDAALRAIKLEALTAGAPGKRTSAACFAHIVRLCIDAGITEKLEALGADHDPA